MHSISLPWHDMTLCKPIGICRLFLQLWRCWLTINSLFQNVKPSLISLRPYATIELPRPHCIKLLLRVWWYVSSQRVMFCPRRSQVLDREIIVCGSCWHRQPWDAAFLPSVQSWNHSVWIIAVHFTPVISCHALLLLLLPAEDAQVARSPS